MDNNYGPTLYCFPHIARYWSKIAKCIYPTCIQRPRADDPAEMLTIGKTRMMVLYTIRWSRFDTVRERDGRTDGQDCYIYIYISRALKTKCRTPTISMKARVKWNAKNTPCTKLINIAGICRYSVAEFRDHPQNFSNSYAIFFIAFSCANTAIVCFSFVRVRLICDLNNSD